MHDLMSILSSRIRPLTVLAALSLVSNAAYGQTEVVAWTADAADEFGFFNTDAGVGVNGQAIVATGNMTMTLLNKSGTVLDTRKASDTNWPFLRVDDFEGTGPLDFPSRFFDPQ
ncbi:MAG: hypothetical protein AAFV77_11420, partial [Planctomycetota bacterium]